MSKIQTFDVFLSHNSLDKQHARLLKSKLSEIGIRAWLDEDELRPGLNWQPLLSEALQSAPTIAVLVGAHGIGPWEDEEIQSALIAAVKDKRPVFAVFLPGCSILDLPTWLMNRGTITVSDDVNEDVLSKFQWAIKGKKNIRKRSGKAIGKAKPTEILEPEDEKEVALAEHAIKVLLGKDKDLQGAEIFPNRIAVTRYVKALVNASKARQRQAIQAIAQQYTKSSVIEKIPLAYLLGRFDDEECKKRASELLIGFLEASGSEGKIREILVLERTIYISLAYLGFAQYARRYCESVLWDSERDDINRGFHLEYYGDTERNAVGIVADYRDNETVFPQRTISSLVQKLSDDFNGGVVRSMSAIDAQTLVSFCVNRHFRGQLPESIRQQVSELVNQLLLVPTDALSDPMRSYLSSGKSVLDRVTASASEMFAAIYRLKEVKRAGWNTTTLRESTPFISKCPHPESVADHVWGAMLIAESFLPSSIDGEPDYSKTRIVRLLMIHDLGEAFLGDTPVWARTSESEGLEREYFRSFSKMWYLAGMNGTSDFEQLLDEFYTKCTINAKIASDIDIIEGCFQVQLYAKAPDCPFPDAEQWISANKDRLSTAEGKRIFELLRPINSQSPES